MIYYLVISFIVGYLLTKWYRNKNEVVIEERVKTHTERKYDSKKRLLETLTYFGHLLHGPHTIYHPNGKPKKRYLYKNGIHMETKKFNLSGTMHFHACYNLHGDMEIVSIINNQTLKNIVDKDKNCHYFVYKEEKIIKYNYNKSMQIDYSDSNNIQFDQTKLGYLLRFGNMVVSFVDSGVKVLSMLDNKNRECAIQKDTKIVWKACVTTDNVPVYVELEVPIQAKRVTPLSLDGCYKSRVEYAKVLSITGEWRSYSSCESFVYGGKKLVYTVGEMVYPDSFDGNAMHSCSNGINVHLYRDQCDIWFNI